MLVVVIASFLFVALFVGTTSYKGRILAVAEVTIVTFFPFLTLSDFCIGPLIVECNVVGPLPHLQCIVSCKVQKVSWSNESKAKEEQTFEEYTCPLFSPCMPLHIPVSNCSMFHFLGFFCNTGVKCLYGYCGKRLFLTLSMDIRFPFVASTTPSLKSIKRLASSTIVHLCDMSSQK